MEQHSIIYCFVVRGAVILAQYTVFTKNFRTIATECLRKLPVGHNNFTYNFDSHTFNYLADESFIGRQVLTGFLERVKDDFNKSYGGPKAGTAVANSLSKEFASKLKEHMQYCVDHPEEIKEHGKVKDQVSKVKGTIIKNIEKVLDHDLKGRKHPPLRPIIWLPIDEESLMAAIKKMGEDWKLVSLFLKREGDGVEKHLRKLQHEGRIMGVQPELQLLPRSKRIKLAEQKDNKDQDIPVAKESIMEKENVISKMILSAQKRAQEIRQESKWINEANEIISRLLKLEVSLNVIREEVLSKKLSMMQKLEGIQIEMNELKKKKGSGSRD